MNYIDKKITFPIFLIFICMSMASYATNNVPDSLVVYMYVDAIPKHDAQSVFSPMTRRIQCTLFDTTVYVKLTELYYRRSIKDKDGQVLYQIPHKSIIYLYELFDEENVWSKKNYFDLVNASFFLLSHKTELTNELYSDHDTIIGVISYKNGIEIDRIVIGEFERYDHSAITEKINIITKLLSRIEALSKVNSIHELKALCD